MRGKCTCTVPARSSRRAITTSSALRPTSRAGDRIVRVVGRRHGDLVARLRSPARRANDACAARRCARDRDRLGAASSASDVPWPNACTRSIPGLRPSDRRRAASATGGARRMNQIDCAAEKSAMLGQRAEQERPAVGEQVSRAGRGSCAAAAAPSASGRAAHVRRHRGAVGAEGLQRLGRRVRRSTCATPAGCIVYGTAVQNSVGVGPLRDDLGHAGGRPSGTAAARAAARRSRGTSARCRSRCRRRSA